LNVPRFSANQREDRAGEGSTDGFCADTHMGTLASLYRSGPCRAAAKQWPDIHV